MAGRRKRVEELVSVEKQMEEDAWRNPNVRNLPIYVLTTSK